MERFTTSTPKGASGINISHADEERCAKSLLDKLSDEWRVTFGWSQILFSDVQYDIDHDQKLIMVMYNQNLTHWWEQLEKEVVSKVKA